ncbi:hypothetical protein VE01_02945 [Pseudogymnoascus verrucosus]|uniref:beta-N-acetylhexosaminidase n=1 Tax=Pseudogymnoascus verrucosus TaxID=342668 RepID=A0A1B8GU92_9PEZI|nr:uncharacterized protein VE01_02945 [Pseudogymnoascus verrucosus]OBT99414.1 hypothetical protein VE01_02945 [Pseudogymnoascus verrucosus]
MHLFTRDGLLKVAVLSLTSSSYGRLLTIPSTPFEEASTGEKLPLNSVRKVIVGKRFASTVNKNGRTLIPQHSPNSPKLLREIFNPLLVAMLLWNMATKPKKGSIFLTIDSDTKFSDVAGRPSSEEYSLSVTKEGITIAGASPLGTWWGTRSVLQAAAVGDNKIPYGTGVDSPGWGTRGVMHSEEFGNNVYHGFRLPSDNPALADLSSPANESYTRAVFDDIQEKCAARGVTVFPELETPGHALAITQWKPQLALDHDISMLNLSHPETLPAVQSIWETFLPWFYSDTVHIGADEYDSGFIDVYIDFVNNMYKFMSAQSPPRKMFSWGTFPREPGQTDINKDVTIQHWTGGMDNALPDYLNKGFNMVNSDDAFYIVGKSAVNSYPRSLNLTRAFAGNPAGGAYAPNIFDSRDATNNPPRDHPGVLGHIAAQWNDLGPNATTVSEAYYAWRDALPGLADKQWGGDLTLEEYEGVFDMIHAAIPAQNLDRNIPSRSDTVAHYKFDSHPKNLGKINDYSGNVYHATLYGCSISNSEVKFDGNCYIETPLQSKGRNYTLSFSIKPTSDKSGALVTGRDSILTTGNGDSKQVILSTGGEAYSVDYSFPVGSWTEVSLIGAGTQTFLTVKSEGGEASTTEIQTILGLLANGLKPAVIAIEAPFGTIGRGFEGYMKDVVLKQTASIYSVNNDNEWMKT